MYDKIKYYVKLEATDLFSNGLGKIPFRAIVYPLAEIEIDHFKFKNSLLLLLTTIQLIFMYTSSFPG